LAAFGRAAPSRSAPNQPDITLDPDEGWKQGPMTTSAAPGTGGQPAYNPTQEERILNLLRPARVDDVELAPDGRHVVYPAYDQYRVRLIIIDIDHPELTASVEVGQGNWWQKLTGASWEPPHVTFLRWASAQRLVFAEGDNGIYAVNADGKGLTKLVTGADVGVPKGQNLKALQPSAPPGMAQAPNQLDLMVGSPTTNMDPMLKAAGYTPQGVGYVNPNAIGANPAIFGTLNGLSNVDPASSHDFDMADGRSDSYINSAGGPDRATDLAAPLETGKSTDLAGDLIPRTARVAAMLPDDPGHIIVEASGAQDPLSGLYSYGYYRVDVATGKRRLLGESALPGHQVWYDQGGRLRIVLGAIGQTYLHVFPGRAVWRGAKPLNSAVRDPAERGFQAKPESYFGARSIPVGFDFDPNILYYASNRGRDTMGLYALNLKTGARTPFAVENPHFDVVDPHPAAASDDSSGSSQSPLVFDAHRRQLVGVRLAGPAISTHWIDPELAQVQARLAPEFPDRAVALLQWDEPRTRFLVLVTGRADPGRYYVFTPADGQLLLCARRAPWLPTEAVSTALAFAFTSPAGVPVSGTLTAARNPRLYPAPLLVLCPDGPGQPLAAEFDAEAQAFAGMGFTVLRVNYRGSSGLGLAHLSAIRAAIDRAPLDDIGAAIDWIQRRTAIDVKRIAVVGEGLGGYLALRAVQVHPERYRCAVSIQGPVDLRPWVGETDLIAHAKTAAEDRAEFQAISAVQQASPLSPLDALHAQLPPPTTPEEDSPALYAAKARRAFFGLDRSTLAAISPARFPQDLIRPIYLIEDAAADRAYLASARALRDAVEKRGGHVESLMVNGSLAALDPVARAKVLAQIEAFLNLDFYSYSVEIGDVKTKD